MANVTTLPVRRPGRLGVMVVIAGVVLALLWLLMASWRNIPPGFVGIVFDKANHKVTAGALEPGWAFINPFYKAIQEYPITIQTYSMIQKSSEGQAGGDESVKVQSNEGQQINLDVVIQFQVIKEEAGALYQDWGGAEIGIVEDRVVRQYTRSTVPVVASKYGWEEITSTKRDVINSEIAQALEIEFKKRHLRLISFAVREVHLPQSLQNALDQKIQAQQAAEQQRYQFEQAKVRAEQDVTEATGKGNAVKAQAEGEAQATLLRAKAQAEANELLAKSLTPELIRYQQLNRWDGKLPLLTGGGVPMFNASDLLAGKNAP